MKIVTRLFLILLCCFILTGCFPSLKSSRYFEYTGGLVVNGSKIPIHDVWSCHEINELSAVNGKFDPRWVDSTKLSLHALELGNNATLLFWRDYANCLTMSDDVVQPRHVWILDSSAAPARIIKFSDTKTHYGKWSVQINSGKFKPLDHSVSIEDASPESKRMFEQLQSTNDEYVYVGAKITPQSEWLKKYDDGNYLNQLHSITLNPKLNALQIVDWHYPQTYELSLEPIGGIWKFISPDPTTADVVFMIKSDLTSDYVSPKDPLTVQYKNIKFQMKGGQRLYDPETKLIIDFFAYPIKAKSYIR